MADELPSLCDEMLAGLGRWLRIAGYDTAIADPGGREYTKSTVFGNLTVEASLTNS